MMELLQRIEFQKTRGQASRDRWTSSAEFRLRPFQQQRLRGRGEVTALDREPRLERRARAEAHPLEQLARKAIEIIRLRQRGGTYTPEIHLDAWLERQLHGIAAQGAGLLERPPDLGEAPSQGPERIVGVGEEEVGELSATGRLAGVKQACEERPRLDDPRYRDRIFIPLGAQRSLEPDCDR